MLEAFFFIHSPKAGTRLEVLALDVEISLMKRSWAFLRGALQVGLKFPKKMMAIKQPSVFYEKWLLGLFVILNHHVNVCRPFPRSLRGIISASLTPPVSGRWKTRIMRNRLMSLQ
jgi:hypothetical protein